MPNIRYTEEEVVDTVAPLIQQAGGRIAHNVLLAALEAQGKGGMMSYIIKSAHSQGTFAGDLIDDGSGAKVVLHYKLRNAPAPQPPAAAARTAPVPPKPAQ